MSDFDAIRARLAAISPGGAIPLWAVREDENLFRIYQHETIGIDTVCAVQVSNNPRWREERDFIAHAPADLRALLDAHDADQARIAALEAALQSIVEKGREASIHFTHSEVLLGEIATGEMLITASRALKAPADG